VVIAGHLAYPGGRTGLAGGGQPNSVPAAGVSRFSKASISPPVPRLACASQQLPRALRRSGRGRHGTCTVAGLGLIEVIVHQRSLCK
jgi:hypothetical protein